MEPGPIALHEDVLWFRGRTLWYQNWLDVENEREREAMQMGASWPRGREREGRTGLRGRFCPSDSRAPAGILGISRQPRGLKGALGVISTHRHGRTAHDYPCICPTYNIGWGPLSGIGKEL